MQASYDTRSNHITKAGKGKGWVWQVVGVEGVMAHTTAFRASRNTI